MNPNPNPSPIMQPTAMPHRQVRRRLAPRVFEKAQALFVYAKQATLHALFLATYPAHQISLASFKSLIPWYVRRAKEETCLCKACHNFKGYVEVLNSLAKVSPTSLPLFSAPALPMILTVPSSVTHSSSSQCSTRPLSTQMTRSLMTKRTPISIRGRARLSFSS